MASTAEILHERFNPRYDQPMPVRVKGFVRKNLAHLFEELGFTRGAEVGVAEALYSQVLLGTNPNLHLHCVDLWDSYMTSGRHIKDKAMQDECWDISHKRLEAFDQAGRVTWVRAASMDAVRQYKPNSLDFVYIDANHEFDYIMQDLIEWSKIVRPGGIVSGHDAYRFRGAGVVDAVSVYTHCHQINEWFVCDEREVSFFWVKP